MTPDVTLTIAGTRYGGWKSLRCRRSLEEAAGAFELGVSEIWPEQSTPREIRPFDACALSIDGEVVITGAVDAISTGMMARDHYFSVSGRDKSADLVDCSAVHGKGEWRNARLDQIARDLAATNGITVKVEADVGAVFPQWAIQEGETAFACIERAARMRGVLLLPDGAGGLVLGKAGTQRIGTALVLDGEETNVLECVVRNDATQRFQQYVVKGQRAGTDGAYGSSASAMKATASDAGVKRARTLVVVADDETDVAGLKKRAEWEATVRAARALTVDVTVQGWSHPGGLWRMNRVVPLRAPALRIERDLLIRDVEYSLDRGGTFTRMTLTPVEAYTPQIAPPARKAPRRKRSRDTGAGDVFS
jgi:prophage tail gpP-like protein